MGTKRSYVIFEDGTRKVVAFQSSDDGLNSRWLHDSSQEGMKDTRPEPADCNEIPPPDLEPVLFTPYMGDRENDLTDDAEIDCWKVQANRRFLWGEGHENDWFNYWTSDKIVCKKRDYEATVGAWVAERQVLKIKASMGQYSPETSAKKRDTRRI